MDIPTTDFVRAGSLEELKAKGRLVVPGPPPPILVAHNKGRLFALNNRCPHRGFPPGPRRGRGCPPALPLAPRPLRSREWLYLRSLGRRRADLPRRSP